MNSAKTGERDESILVDSIGYEWFGPTVLLPLTRNRDPQEKKLFRVGDTMAAQGMPQ